MQKRDKTKLEGLQQAALCSKAAATAWREQLIESLGDMMCGSGIGPSTTDMVTYAHLADAAERDAETLAWFLIRLAMSREPRGTSSPAQRLSRQSGAGLVRNSSQ